MPLDRNGNYERWQGPDRCKNDRDADIEILASRMDDDLNDMADATGQMLTADGRKPMSGALKMGGNGIKNIRGGDAATDVPSIEQVQRSMFNYAADSSSEANVIKVDLSPIMTQLPRAGFVFVKVANSNTGKTTLQINQLEAKPVYLGEQEIGEGMLLAGQVYPFFYNNDLDAFQLIPSGSLVGQAVPPFTMIMLDHLLTGQRAIGWELQGTRCYKSKYWEQYQQLVDEYADAVDRTETVEETEFSYKLNLDTMRRFYTKNAYDERFELCGDSGGYVLDEETYSFYLPKSNNYMRPAVDADNLEAYQTDTMRPITGRIGNKQEPAIYEGAFYRGPEESGVGRNYKSDTTYTTSFDSARLGTHYNGEETAPKSRFVAVYYKLGVAYTEQISSAVFAAENYAKTAQESANGIDAQVSVAQTAATSAQESVQAAERAQDAAQTSESNAADSASAAASAEEAAAQAAETAEQSVAGIAEYANVASTAATQAQLSAETATAQANIATTNATVAKTNAEEAQQSAALASASAQEAEEAVKNIPTEAYTPQNLIAGKNVTITEVLPEGGIDEHTVACWHFDGTQEDSSGNNNTFDASLEFDSDKYKFGTGSIKNTSNSTTTSAYCQLTKPIKINEPFTLDFWGYWSLEYGYISFQDIYLRNEKSDQVETIAIGNSWRNDSKTFGLKGAYSVNADIQPANNVWSHMALVGTGTELLLFLNGQKVAQATVNQANAYSLNWLIVSFQRSNIDELRVSDVARWTEDFTPPEKAYNLATATGQKQINAILPQNADYVVESYTDPETGNWYRVYKSGWVEQGGFLSALGSLQTITFIKPFNSTSYYFNRCNAYNSTASSGFQDEGYVNKTSTSIQVYTQGTKYITNTNWYACGQGA